MLISWGYCSRFARCSVKNNSNLSCIQPWGSPGVRPASKINNCGPLLPSLKLFFLLNGWFLKECFNSRMVTLVFFFLNVEPKLHLGLRHLYRLCMLSYLHRISQPYEYEAQVAVYCSDVNFKEINIFRKSKFSCFENALCTLVHAAYLDSKTACKRD